MSEIKKYLDTTALGTLVDEIKKADTATLTSAKGYADSLAKNYDASGAANTAKTEAIADADAKFAVVNENVAKKADATALEAEVTRATQKEGELSTAIDGVDAKAIKNAEDIAAINNADTGILKQAKDYADTEIGKVQEAVDAVEEKIGEVPEDKTIKEYIDEKTSGIATDAALGELQAAVDAVEGDVATIKGDYLKASDKTALEGKITAEETARTQADEGLSTRIKAVEDDYLKAADKTELTNAIATAKSEAIATVLGEGVNADFDTLKEVADWILSDTTGAAALQTDVATLKQEMDAVEADVEQAQKDIDAVEAAVATKVELEAYNTKIAALESADAGQVERIVALENAIGESGSVADDIATAKQAAIDAAAADATTKANAAEANAKSHANDLNSAMNTRVEALEAVDHEHANKTELDLIATGDKAKWDAAAAKAHEHANAAELAKIADGDVAKWNASEQNAKTYADGLNSAMTTKVDGIDGRIGTLETAIVDKAEADDLDAAVERIEKNESDIASLTSSLNSFTPITSDEVSAMFA